MIIVAGKLYVDPDAREGYLADSLSSVEQARAAAGCVDFTLSADPIEASRINVFEQWESDEHLEAFRGSGPDSDQAVQIRDARVQKFRISATEEP